MSETMLPLAGLSPVNGKALSARFDGGALTSDAGFLALREVERRLDVAGRLATGIGDPRDPTRTVHSVTDILRFRLLLIAAGYEDGIDANTLRADPVFKVALERLPGERDLCSQSTISRLENLPDRRMLLRLARAPRRPAGRLRFANRIDRLLPVDDRALLRELRAGAEADHARRRRHLRCGAWWPAAAVVQRPLRRLRFSADRRARRCRPVRDRGAAAGQAPQGPRDRGPSAAADPRDPPALAASRDSLARRQPLLRARGPRLLPCARRGLHSRPRRQRHLAARVPDAPARRGGRRRVATLEQATIARVDQNSGTKVRRFKEFHDAAASWSRVERIIARVEAGPQGCDTRFPPRSPDRVSSGDRMKGLLAFHCHQPHPWQWQGALRKALLRPRPGRESHQGVEDPPRRRSPGSPRSLLRGVVAPPAPAPPPTSSGSSCTPAPTG